MSQLDLSHLPEALREKLQAQLDLLPAAYRGRMEEQLGKLPTDQLRMLVERGSPMLDKLIARLQDQPRAKPSAAGQKPAKPGKPPTTSGHFNSTVQAGDRPAWHVLVVLVALIAGGVIAVTSGLVAN